MPTKSIIHITSRCGGGKSFHTITELHQHLLKIRSDGKVPSFFILASKTNNLSQQNHDQFKAECIKSQSGVSCKLIDSHSASSNVVTDISDYLKYHKEGVLFISHAAVSLIDPSLLVGTTIIFDEVPDNLVKEMRIFHENKDEGQYWEKFITYQPQSNTQLQKVILDANVDCNEVLRYINNIKTNKDNITTLHVADILQFLLDGHEDLYFMTKNHSNIKQNIYTGIDWRRLDEIRKYASSIVVLSAELKRTLFGFVAENIADLDIEEASITPNITLQTKHKKQAIIYPILKNKNWSSYRKNQNAVEILADSSLSILPNETVFEHALRIVASKFVQTNYLLITNKTEGKKIESEGEFIKIISSTSHGSNSYSDYHHAAYLASKHPDPIEEISLGLFASKYKQKPKDLIECVITERCYESAYQCLARTSIRNADYCFEESHLFLVPDMQCAEYVASWFEQGYATIDTSLSCSVKPTKKKQDKTAQEKELLIKIITENKTNKTSIKVLVKQLNTSTSTYNRLREKYKKEMQKMGLMK